MTATVTQRESGRKRMSDLFKSGMASASYLVEFRRTGDTAIRARAAQAEGDLPAEAEPEELTNFIRTASTAWQYTPHPARQAKTRDS